MSFFFYFIPKYNTTTVWANRQILPRTFWCLNIRTLIFILFWESSSSQKCYASVAWAQPSFFVYIHRVLYVCLVLRTAAQNEKNTEVDFMFVERPSLENADSRCMSQKRRESYMVFYWKAPTHTPWSAETYGSGATVYSRTVIWSTLSRPPALLEVSVGKK